MPTPSASPAAARPAAIAAALLVGPQVAAKATRDALFLTTFGAAALPAMSAAAALCSLLATLGFSRALSRLSPARLLPTSLGASALLFLAEWGLAREAPRLAAVVVYLHQAVLGAVLLSGFWSFVNERFDPHAAKRAMGAIGAGASVGGVLGGALTWGGAQLAGPVAMLPVLAVASLAGLASVLTLGTPQGSAAPPPATGGPSGVGLVWRVAYLRNLAVLVGLCALVESVLDYLLGAAAADRLPPGAGLMSFFALFHGGTGVLALALQAAVARGGLARLGVAGTLAVWPAFTVLGSALALAAPRFLAIALLRGGQAALRGSFFRSAYELLYTPLPTEQKRPAKVLVDVACDRLGTVAGSAVVMAVLTLGAAGAPLILLAVAVAGGAAALAVARRFTQGYVGALAQSLRAGVPTVDGQDLVEPTALLTLASIRLDVPSEAQAGAPAPATGDDALLAAIVDLRSGDPERICRVAAGRDLDPALTAHVIPLLLRDELLSVLVPALRRAARRHTGQLVDALLDPGVEPAVRRRIARVLKGVPSPRAADGLVRALRDDRFDIRYRCAQALLRLREQDPSLPVPAETLLEQAAREAARAGDSPRHLEHVFTLLGVALDPAALRIAHEALRLGDVRLRGTALEYLDNVLPAAARQALLPHLGSLPTPTPSRRSPQEVRDDLLRSAASVRVSRRRR